LKKKKQRKKIEKGLKPKKRKNLFGFLTKKRETYHAHIVRPKATMKRHASYQGKVIYKTPEGDFTTSIDRDSRHDTLADAKAFIRSFKTNPNKRQQKKTAKKRAEAWARDWVGKRTGRRRAKSRGTQGYRKATESQKYLGQYRQNRGNPLEASRDGYRGFHGHESEKVTRVVTPIHEHKYLAGLGDLRKLVIVTPDKKYRVKVKFTKPYPLLSMNEDRTQLFIDGGDQSVNVSDFGIKNAHEKEVLGHLTDVFYFTTKDHLRPEDGGKAVYHHKFGKVKPTMVYDVLNKLIEFAGGGYTIPDEGIDG
jgi:hypothetical protein